MSEIKIVADENIPKVKEIFSNIGVVKLLPGRNITSKELCDADVLLVRSVTPVDSDLLSRSNVRFVGTATIGTDHVDIDYLNNEGISFSSAPGSNARSVAEYITAALLTLARRKKVPLRGQSIGVVGAGNVGSRVVKKAEALGMTVIKNDPPLARRTGDDSYRPIDEVLECDYITLHVPLEKGGPDPTHHLVNEEFIDALRPETMLFNSSRGAVVKGQALKKALVSDKIKGAVLDVWENEPAIDHQLVELVDIATPHIAGYSLDGKYAGVEMLYRALCGELDLEPDVDIESLKPKPGVQDITVHDISNFNESLLSIVKKVYDITEDDRKLRGIFSLHDSEHAEYFDDLRKNYPVRREFYTVKVKRGPDISEEAWEPFKELIGNMGFRTD